MSIDLTTKDISALVKDIRANLKVKGLIIKQTKILDLLSHSIGYAKSETMRAMLDINTTVELTYASVNRLAKKICSLFKETGSIIKETDVLDIIANCLDYKDRNDMRVMLNKNDVYEESD